MGNANIIDGLREALDVARGDDQPTRVTVRPRRVLTPLEQRLFARAQRRSVKLLYPVVND